MGLHLRICRDAWGTWSVYGLSPLPVSHLPSLSATIDYAREECSACPATIVMIIDGVYVVVHQESGWPRQLVAPDIEPPLDAAEGAASKGPGPFGRFRDWLSGVR